MIFIFLLVSVVFVSFAGAQNHSELWGPSGEKWHSASRLPDFSFAGYQKGEKALPSIKQVCKVTDFGAVPDDDKDDTKAFLKAIEQTKAGAIYIPAGKYLLSDIIWIKKPGIVLRGAGQGKTVLHFSGELQDVLPDTGSTTSGRETSRYSWSGGFIWAQGSVKENKISDISSDAKLGDDVITLSSTSGIKKGQEVLIQLEEDSPKSLIQHIYSMDSGNVSKVSKTIITMNNRVIDVTANKVTLERPLRFDIKQAWKPELRSLETDVSEVGIEDLTIDFPIKPYKGHFTERGMNGIALTHVLNSWIKNVQISNSDSGLFLTYSSFCTVSGVLLDSQRNQSGLTGHHGIKAGNDCLIEDFDIRTRFIHDLTVGKFQTGNVFKNGRALSLSVDHHKKGPFANLFTNIDAGDGTSFWRCGGGKNLGKNSAGGTTFWCIKSDRQISPPPGTYGPVSMNLVGMNMKHGSVKEANGKWIEAIAAEKLIPADLHTAQLKRRLKLGNKAYKLKSEN